MDAQVSPRMTRFLSPDRYHNGVTQHLQVLFPWDDRYRMCILGDNVKG
jgi:hypothetical protein